MCVFDVTTGQARAIFAVPNPLQYFGWVFCFTSFFAGPAFEFREYLDTTRRSDAETAKLPSRAAKVLVCFLQGVRPRGLLHRTLHRMLHRLLHRTLHRLFLSLVSHTLCVQVLFLGLSGYGNANFPFLVGTAPNITITPAIAAQPTLLHAAALGMACLFFVRTRYYFGWLVTEGSAVLAGFGYVPEAKNWGGVSNVDVLNFEFAGNVSIAAKAWNQVCCERTSLRRLVLRAVHALCSFSPSTACPVVNCAFHMCVLYLPLPHSAHNRGWSATCTSVHRGRTT